MRSALEAVADPEKARITKEMAEAALLMALDGYSNAAALLGADSPLTALDGYSNAAAFLGADSG